MKRLSHKESLSLVHHTHTHTLPNSDQGGRVIKMYQWDAAESASFSACISHTGCLVSEHKSRERTNKQEIAD